MLYGLAVVWLGGLACGALLRRLHLPPLLGMILWGIVAGPHALGLITPDLMGISADLRRLALVVILLRAGLKLDLGELRRVGRPTVLLCFVPACCEIMGTMLLAPRLLGLSLVEAALLGAVIAAVSPAVVVPRMLHLMEQGYGTGQGIPQMIMAGASADDVFVLVLFTAFSDLAAGRQGSAAALGRIPVTVVCGILAGVAMGALLGLLFNKAALGRESAVVVVLSAAILLLWLEAALADVRPLSGLLGVVCMGMVLYKAHRGRAARLSGSLSSLWAGAEILLFVLVGAEVDLRYAAASGLAAAGVVLGAALFRMVGVALCTVGTKLRPRERLFCMIAYLPKATVQAAIGAAPLAMGLACGHTVLTGAVVSILLTAPLGAIGIDGTYRRLLTQPQAPEAEG